MFSSNISRAEFCHDINSTMNALTYLVDQLEHSDLDQHQIEMVETLKNATKTMIELVKDYGTDKKNAFSISAFNDNSIDPVKLIKNVCELFKYQAEMKGLQFRLYVHVDIGCKIIANELKFTRVLMNIIGNAIKYTDEGTIDIHVTTALHSTLEEKLSITCIDTGIGISNENLPYIFDRGFRDPLAYDSGVEGNGFGLNITKNIVDELGGNIQVESKKGKGTKIQMDFNFTIYDDYNQCNQTEHHEFLNCIRGKNILIADDNEINILLLKSMLDRNGVNVNECTSGIEAIEKLQYQTYDLVMLDLHMPDMNGIQVFNEIKSRLNSNVPVMAITAEVFNSDHTDLQALGFVDVISKPVEEHELMYRIGKIFSAISY